MLEICVSIAAVREMFLHAPQHGLALLGCVFGFAITVVAEISGDHVGRGALLGLSDTERTVVLLQARKDVIGEPGLVPKLERSSQTPGNCGQEFLQQFGIRLHVRRQLKKHAADLPCLRKRLDRADKAREKFLRVLQAFDVCDDLVRLDGEAEVRRGLRDPFRGGRIFQQLAKGQVDLHRIQLAGVVRKEFRLRKLFRIKRGFPAWIGPSGSAAEKLRHVKKRSALSIQHSAKCENRIISFRHAAIMCVVPGGTRLIYEHYPGLMPWAIYVPLLQSWFFARSTFPGTLPG